MVFSSTMLVPAAFAWLNGDGMQRAFLTAYGITLASGLIIWLPARGARRELRLRDGFVVVTLFWALLALFGALPFQFAGITTSMADAYFETMSGLTTTGSTVLTGLDNMPRSINLWRAELQFLGGMGIVVLAVAILPMLGVGGMQLFKAETPGPMKDSKLTPRIKETAKALWYVYLTLTLICIGALWLAGMTPFEAVIHSFTALSTGGFSNHDASIAYYDSAAIEMILAVFMFLGGASFALHFLAVTSRDPSLHWRDSEFRSYLLIVLTVTLVIAAALTAAGIYPNVASSLRYALFQVVSMATTTGYMSADFGVWPPALGALLMIISFFAGSAGSTSGGIKVVRMVLLFKQTLCEIKRLIHPNAQVPLKLSGKVVPDRTLAAVAIFFVVYVAVFVLIGILVAALGTDLVTAFSATAAALNNTGPGLGAVGPAFNFASLPEAAKWLLSAAMLLGRLELFTLLVLLTPTFWRA